jgi:hypothetical protein
VAMAGQVEPAHQPFVPHFEQRLQRAVRREAGRQVG